MLIGAILIVGSILAASYCTNFILFLIFFCLFFPMGVGIIYWPPIMSSWEWFGPKKGLATGLIIGAFGFGSFFFGFITTAIVNPNNQQLYTDPESGDDVFPGDVALKVPGMLRTVSAIFAVLLGIGIMLVQRNPLYAMKEKEIVAQSVAGSRAMSYNSYSSANPILLTKISSRPEVIVTTR